MAHSSLLWYNQPASQWNEALPIGNGRLGCMIHGRTGTELLCLNEESVWYGGPQDRLPEDARPNLPRLRELVRNGQHTEAERLAERAFLATPSGQRHYEPLGTVKINFSHDFAKTTQYRRELDLEKATHTTKYSYDGTQMETTMAASFPDHTICMTIETSRPIEFVISMSRLGDKEHDTTEFVDSVQASKDRIIMFVTPGGHGSVRACCVLGVKVDIGGTVEALNGKLVINARETYISISARTTFRHSLDFDNLTLSDVSAALEKDTHQVMYDHVQDYRSLYARMQLSLGPPTADDHLPTDQRLQKPPTPSLSALYTNYGRYLLISSSRDTGSPQDLPANLQGIWNPSFSPAWGSKYTLNINLQMNYWPCLPSNLHACMKPMLALLRSMAAEDKGRKTAREMYGARGWCCHHNTDLWADTDPAERWMPAALWPLGGAWMCYFIWEYYLFTLDRSMLEKEWGVLKGAVEFCLDWLVEEEMNGENYLVTNPSLSPENTFMDGKGNRGVFCRGSAADVEIISSLFGAFIGACEVLSLSDSVLQEVHDAIARLPPPKICPYTGTIQEWGLHDYAQAEPGHRHVSHLIGLYPYSSITPIHTSELATAAAKTLEERLSHGGGHTGWSRAHLLCLYTRLHDPTAVEEQIDKLIAESTFPNLLDTHPPFQIDGNFGGAAGVLEALVQSHEVKGDRRVIRILPACPKAWSTGVVRGLRVRGGWSVGFEWRHGVVAGGVDVDNLAPRGVGETRKGLVVFPEGKEVEFEGGGPHMIEN